MRVSLSRLLSIALGFFLLAGGFFVFTGTSEAAFLKQIHYQGRLYNSAGVLQGGSGTQFCFKFSIYEDATVGAPDTKLWPTGSPTGQSLNVQYGVFNYDLGSDATDGDLGSIDWQTKGDTAYLQIEAATKVGPDCTDTGGVEVWETLSPRQRVVSQANALNADKLQNASPGTGNSNILKLNANGGIDLTGTTAGLSAAGANTLTLNASSTGNIQFFGSSYTLSNTGSLTIGSITGTGALTIAAGGSNTALVLNANGTGKVQLAAGSTGDIEFFNTNNKISSSGNLTIAGGITAATSSTINGVSINSGAVSGVSTLGLTGAITGATSTNTINGLIINAGALSGITTINASGQITSTLATGTAPFVVSSTTNVANLNASSLNGATFAAPGTIGGTTPGAATFTTLTAQTSITSGGTGTSALLQSPINDTVGSEKAFILNHTGTAFGQNADLLLELQEGGVAKFSINRNGLITTASVDNSSIVSSAGIAYSKLNLATSIVGGDLAANISLSTTGNIATTGTGTITSAGLLTGSNGLTISSGTVTLPSASIADSALSTNVALKNTSNTFTADQTIATATATDDTIVLDPFTGGAARFSGSITTADLTAARTYTLPNESGTICTTGSVCAGYQASGSYANTALSNLASVALNTALLPGANNMIDLGSGTLQFRTAYIGTSLILGTSGANSLTLSFTAPTAANTITFPNAGGTVAVSGTSPVTISATGAISVGDATTAAKGIASFNSTNFTVSSGAVNTIQNINTAASPTFAGLTLAPATATDDTLVLTPFSGGAARFSGTQTTLDLTAARTYTFQNDSGIVPLSTAGNTVFFTTTGATALTLPTTGTVTAQGNTVTGSGSIVLATSPTITTPNISSIVNTGTLTLPTANDTLVGRATTDILTNKTLRGAPVFDTVTATDDTLTLLPFVGGAARFNGSITSADLTAARTYTLPDAGGTFAVAGSSAIGLSSAGSISLTLSGATADATTTSNSGLVVTSTGVSLLRGCGASQILKWTSPSWACANDDTGAAGTPVNLDPAAAQTSSANANAIFINRTALGSLLNLTQNTTLAAAYTGEDNLLKRNLVGGTNAQGGSLVVLRDTSTGTGTINPTALLIDFATPTGATLFTGNFVDFKKADSAGGATVSKFSVSSAGNITAAGTVTLSAFGTAGVVHNSSTGLLSSSLIVNADVDTSAAIAYSKLNLSSSIVGGDLAANITISTTGNIATTGTGTVTSAGLLTASNGFTLTTGTLTLPSASIADAALSANVSLLNAIQSFTAAKTFATSTATDDTLTLSPFVGGAARFLGTITSADLTAARTYTFQNDSGIVPLSTAGNTVFFTTSGTTTLTLPTTGTVTALGNTVTGSGSIVLATSPTISGPTLTGTIGLGTTGAGSVANTLINNTAGTEVALVIDHTGTAFGQSADLLLDIREGGVSKFSVNKDGNVSGNQFTSTVSTGTAPFVVSSTTNVANLNASSLNGATFANPGTIGGTTPGAATFTTLTAQTSITSGTTTVGGLLQAPIDNTAGTEKAFILNHTGTALVQAADRLFEVQEGGVAKFSVDKDGLVTTASINNASVATSAGIVYSKLNLATSIVGGDLATNISISTTGNLVTTSTGTITSAGLLTASNGFTLSSGTLTLPSASVADAALSTNVALLNAIQSFTAAKTFATATATDDTLSLTPFAGGAARFLGSITSADLTAARTYTFQNDSGIVPLSTAGNTVFFTTTGATALTLPTTGTVTAQGNTVTGSGAIVLQASPTLTGTVGLGATGANLTFSTLFNNTVGTDTALIVNHTGTAFAQAGDLLADFQEGGVSKLSVNKDGNVVAAGSIQGTTATLTGATPTLTLGTASSATGGVVFQNGTNGNSVTINSGVTSPSSYTLTLPIAQASGVQFLQNDGSGVLSWAASAGGCATCIFQVPGTTAQNTIAPTAASVVALTVKGTTGTAANVLEIFDSTATPTRQSFFDTTAAFNTTKQIISTLSTGTAPFSVASTTNVANLNASSLNGATFAAPGAIGGTTPGAGTFTTLTAQTSTTFGTTTVNGLLQTPINNTAGSEIAFILNHTGTAFAQVGDLLLDVQEGGVSKFSVNKDGNVSGNQFTSTVSTGTAPFVVSSTTNVANLNASSLNGATFAEPGAIGGTTAGAGTFTTLAAQTSFTLGLSGTAGSFSIPFANTGGTDIGLVVNHTGTAFAQAADLLLDIQEGGVSKFSASKDGNIVAAGTINTNTFSSTTLTFSGASPNISASTTNTPLTINSNGSGTITLASSSTGNVGFYNVANNFITSSGALTIAGAATINGTGTSSIAGLTTLGSATLVSSTNLLQGTVDTTSSGNFLRLINEATEKFRVDVNGAVVAASSLTTGVLTSANGSLVFNSSNAGSFATTINASSSQSASYTLTLPTGQASGAQFLQNNGSGVLSWVTGGGSGCSTCLQQVPAADADNTVVPTADVTSLTLRQTSNGTPTKNIFAITNSANTVTYASLASDATWILNSAASKAFDLQQGGSSFVGLTTAGALSLTALGTNQNTTLNGSGSGTVSIGGTSTGNVLLAGGLGGAGCTVTNSNGNFDCNGTINGLTLSSTQLTFPGVGTLLTTGDLAFQPSTRIVNVNTSGGANFLRVYNGSNYAEVTHNGTNAVFGGNTGAVLGSGSGNVTISLLNAADIFQLDKTFTAAAAYSTTDSTFLRNITGGTNAITGSILTIKDTTSTTGGGTNAGTAFLVDMATPASSNLFTGTLLDLKRADTAGSATVSKFSVSALGALVSAGGLTTGGNLVFSAATPTISASTTNTTLAISANGSGTITLGSSSTGDIQFYSASNKITNAGALTIAAGATLGAAPTLTNASGTLTISSAGALAISSGGTNTDVTVNAIGTGNIIVGGTVLGGLVRIGDGTNNVTFAATSRALTYNGTARPKRKVTLAPEYAGATLTGTGTGTMTSDFCEQGVHADIPDTNTTSCESGQIHNYYNWTTTSGSNQTYTVWIRWRVPDNFAAFDSSGDPVKVYGRRSDATNGLVTVFLYDTAGALENTSGTNVAGAANTWVTTSIEAAPYEGTYTAGSYMTLRIDMVADNADNVKVGEIDIEYLSSN